MVEDLNKYGKFGFSLQNILLSLLNLFYIPFTYFHCLGLSNATSRYYLKIVNTNNTSRAVKIKQSGLEAYIILIVS